jgi:hypothetical protein
MKTKQDTIQVGALYKHYKGNTYRVHSIVRHSETLEELVLYEALYENELGSLWVRPVGMFLEEIIVAGSPVPRFSLIAE